MSERATITNPGVIEIGAETQDGRSIGRVVRSLIQVAIGVGLVTWLVQSGALQWPTMSRLSDAPGMLSIAMALVIGNYVFLSLRLKFVVRASGGDVAWTDALRFTLAGAFAGWLIPGGMGSDLTKAYLLGRDSCGSVGTGIGAAMVDRILGLTALMTLAVVGQIAAWDTVSGDPALRVLFLACSLLLGAFVALFLVGHTMSAGTTWCEQNPAEASRGMRAMLLRIMGAMVLATRRPWTMCAAFLWSLCAQASIVAAAIVICMSLRNALPNLATCALIPVGFVANALPLAPGGLGVGEAVFESLFTLAGTMGGAETALSWRTLAVIGSLPGLWFVIRLARMRQSARPGSGELLATA